MMTVACSVVVVAISPHPVRAKVMRRGSKFEHVSMMSSRQNSNLGITGILARF
jgi:hypothetical protein